MRQTRVWSIVTLVVLVGLLATACAGPVTASQVEEVAGGVAQAAAQYLPTIRLPRLTLNYDADGVPKLFGIRTSAIENLLGINLSFLNLPPDLVDQMIDSNIQHLEVETTEAGLFVYVNGKGLPYLAWDEASLDRAGDLVVTMEAVSFATALDKAVMLLPRLGVDLVLQFPAAEGEQAIPLRDRNVRALAEPAEIEPSAQIDLVVRYSAEGVPDVMGITSQDLQSLTGMSFSFLELSPGTVQTLQAAGMQRAAVATEPDGLHLSINGNKLLHLAYTQEHLVNAIEVARPFLGEGPLTDNLPGLVPLVYAADVNLVLEFSTGQ